MDIERAIRFIKDIFEATLARALHFIRVFVPLFIKRTTGLNDDLNGVERPVSFEMKDAEGQTIGIIHLLAKWKRLTLKRYGISLYEGTYTDVNAIRRDETLDNTHSICVDQRDWEKVTVPTDRTLSHLQQTVNQLYNASLKTEVALVVHYPKCKAFLPREVIFVSSQEPEDRYPTPSPRKYEEVFAKERGVIFITQTGKTLRSGKKYDSRVLDYDDWELSGDLILWNPVLDNALELSSTGIRADEKSLADQLQAANAEHRKSLGYHQMLLKGELPLIIGGDIGQSCICVLLMQEAYTGEIQASIWTDDMLPLCEESGIQLL